VNSAGPKEVAQAPIEVGDALSTAADGRAELRLTDLVLAEIGGSSELSMVTPTASAHRLRLDRGRLQARVNDRPSAAPKLVIETPNVDVVVTGTVFQVDVTPGKAQREFVTSVSVTKGRVVVRHGAQAPAAITARSELVVRSGRRSSAGAGGFTCPSEGLPRPVGATASAGGPSGHRRKKILFRARSTPATRGTIAVKPSI
jgi:ferric-dicitrate binding protein FerR (iron transport regulator)